MADILGTSISEWLDLMADTVTITPWTGQSVSGVPTYGGTPVSYSAYINMKNRLIVDAQGREILAKGRVILGTTTLVSVKDKITLPSDYVPQSPPILAVNLVPDELGTHHVTLDIG
jgi:hypothetical protein